MDNTQKDHKQETSDMLDACRTFIEHEGFNGLIIVWDKTCTASTTTFTSQEDIFDAIMHISHSLEEHLNEFPIDTEHSLPMFVIMTSLLQTITNEPDKFRERLADFLGHKNKSHESNSD